MSTILETVIAIAASQCQHDGVHFTEKSSLEDDCGLDSLDAVEIALEIEDKFGIKIEDDAVEKWKTIGDIVDLVKSKGPFGGNRPWTERLVESVPSETAVGTEARVIADITERQKKGLAKYGRTVEDNPLSLKSWLQHAYEETLDQAIYLKRAIEELEK